MLPSDRKPQGLEEIRELNKLFLDFLRKRVQESRERLGLPAEAAAAIGAISESLLDDLAAFPRAMFRLDVEAIAAPSIMDPSGLDLDPAHQALQLTLLLSAWNLARKSAYAARLFLGLSDSELEALTATALSDLPSAALTADMVRCAFEGLDWLWPKLLTETGTDSRRQLLLIGLQPKLASAELAA